MPFPNHILDRMLAPEIGNLSPDVARYFLDLEFTATDRDRCEELSYKAQDGSLTLEERQELDWYLVLDAFLIRLQSKARRSLEQHPSAA